MSRAPIPLKELARLFEKSGRARGERCRLFLILRIQEFHIQAEAAHFLDENVKALGNARFEIVLALDDAFIDLGPARDVIRPPRPALPS